jgi:hypothetical protein
MRPAGTPDVSIVIRAFNEERVLPVTLRAIERQDFVGSVQVVLVDSGSRDRTLDIAREAGADIVELRRRYSPGLATNVGFEAARAPVCVLLSAPAFPANERWLGPLVGPLLTSSPGQLAATFSRQVPLPGASPIEDPFLEMAFAPDRTTVAFSATSAAVRRDVWEEHPFEETFEAGGPDDREWYDRILRENLTAAYVPDSVVHRSHGYSLDQWFRRVWVDAAGERIIGARGGASLAPTQSAVALATATLASLVRRRLYGELARYLLLAPVLASARWAGHTGRDPDRLGRITRPLDAVDRRLFQPAEREAWALDLFLRRFWATASEPIDGSLIQHDKQAHT